MVTEVLAALDEVHAPPHVERGRPLDVIRHLGAIEPTGYDPAVDAILEEFLRIAPWLPWRQTAGHLGVLRADYLDNYGYVQLIGPPPSIIEHASVRVGIGLWGPRLDYPLHEHADPAGRRDPHAVSAPPCPTVRPDADVVALLLDG